MELLLFLVAIFATTIGAMSGMGGGIIIKPVMDAMSGMNVSTINFMSGCTVLGMAVVSVYRGRNEELDINYPISLALALGGCVGGVLGKILFEYMTGNTSMIQSSLLLVLNVAIYVYVKFKARITTLQVTNLGACALIGGGLGGMSSFLGIGGGPINIAVLGYFFSSSPKVTAKRSIFIILLSQISSLMTVLISGVPENVNYIALCLMIVGGCLGAVFGGKISKKLSEAQIEDFFTDVLVGIICLNTFNIGRLL